MKSYKKETNGVGIQRDENNAFLCYLHECCKNADTLKTTIGVLVFNKYNNFLKKSFTIKKNKKNP